MLEQCLNCRHLNPISGGCKAYPGDIPQRFVDGDVLHNSVEIDQKGTFVFEEGEPDELSDL